VGGVNNSRQVVGTVYRSVRKDLDSIKEEIAKQTTNRISFVEIHEVEHEFGRVILFVSSGVAKVTGHQAAYIHARGQDDEFYAKLIMDYLGKFDKASRKEIDTLLWNKLSDAFDDDQKKVKISNLLTNIRRSGRIFNAGSKKVPVWRIAE